MVPDVVMNTRGPFWGHVAGVLRRLVEGRLSRLDCAGGAALVLGVILRAADRKTGIWHDPLTGVGHLSIRRLAQIAKTSLSVTKRVRRALEHDGFLTFTKNIREKDPVTGKWRSLEPSIRRLSWDRVFAGWPPSLRSLFEGWNKNADRKAARREAERLEQEAQQRRAYIEAQLRNKAAKRRPLAPQQAVPMLDPGTRWGHVDEIEAEHPEWTDQQKFQELRRRAAAPPTRGPSEPQTSDGPASKS